jgi:HEAT repeat protein
LSPSQVYLKNHKRGASVVKPIKSKFFPSLSLSFLSFLLPLLFLNNSRLQEWEQVRTQTKIDTLIEMFENHYQHDFSPEAPEDRASKAIPTSLKAFKDEAWHVSNWLALVLGSISLEAEEIILALIEALQDREGEIRKRAAYALGNISKEATEAAVPALIEALKDEAWQVRSGAAYALGSIGAQAKDTLPGIIPALIKALNDEEGKVRSRAASALEGIGAQAKDAVCALIETLKDKEESVRIQAALALGSIGTQAKEAIPALIETLNDKERYVRSFTADALVQIAEDLWHKKDTSSIPQLQTILKALEENEAEFAAGIQSVRSTLAALNDRGAS